MDNKAVEKIAERLAFNFFVRCCSLPKGVTVLEEAHKEAEFILSAPNIIEIDPDAELPRITNTKFPTLTFKHGYQEAQQDILDAGWVKKRGR